MAEGPGFGKGRMAVIVLILPRDDDNSDYVRFMTQ